MKKIKLGKNALILAISSLLAVSSWIGFGAYRAITQTTISPTIREQISPLSAEINKKVINDLKETLIFSEEELNTAPIPTPTTVETSQTTTGSAILEEE